MKHIQFVVPFLVAAAFAAPANAASGYSALSDAQAACGAESVVWVDLDHGRYYKPGQAEFGHAGSGIYSCERQAQAQYRPGKSAASTVAAQ